MNWADLFERAEAHATDVETIRDELAVRRDADSTTGGGREDDDNA